MCGLWCSLNFIGPVFRNDAQLLTSANCFECEIEEIEPLRLLIMSPV
jgi:hypothetical protein